MNNRYILILMLAVLNFGINAKQAPKNTSFAGSAGSGNNSTSTRYVKLVDVNWNKLNKYSVEQLCSIVQQLTAEISPTTSPQQFTQINAKLNQIQYAAVSTYGPSINFSPCATKLGAGQ